MAEELQVDTDVLGKAAGPSAEMAALMADAARHLSAELGRIGPVWGSGESGDAFLSGYEHPSRALVDAMGSARAAITNLGDGINTLTVGLTGVEDANLEDANRINKGTSRR